jgi:hypothetical protein
MEKTISVLILFALQLFDWYSTRTVLKRGGIEQNPIAAEGMKILGMDGFLGAKTVFVTCVGFYLSEVAPSLVWGLCAVYLYVALHNAKSL